MASALICANVVTEQTVTFSDTITGSPQFAPVALGDEFHVVITGAEAIFGENPQIEFSYHLSLEYQFATGYDYCHIEGTGTAALPEGVHPCPAVPAIVDYTPTLTDVVLTDGTIGAVLNVEFTVTVCQDRMLNVQLA
ncbi:MAG: hypothetical protein QMC81_05130 [Thermoanaerobacterales bacterium]|nr:hypothetical protein [Bacillota bacterium]MDI6906856.1 hypothetical protein [Thermoanaerobacterales bacterium]